MKQIRDQSKKGNNAFKIIFTDTCYVRKWQLKSPHGYGHRSYPSAYLLGLCHRRNTSYSKRAGSEASPLVWHSFVLCSNSAHLSLNSCSDIRLAAAKQPVGLSNVRFAEGRLRRTFCRLTLRLCRAESGAFNIMLNRRTCDGCGS